MLKQVSGGAERVLVVKVMLLEASLFVQSAFLSSGKNEMVKFRSRLVPGAD